MNMRGQHSFRWHGAGPLAGGVWLAVVLLVAPWRSGAEPLPTDAPTTPAAAPAIAPSSPDTPVATAEPNSDPALPQLAISALEPRYVSPTRRDHIGRIWAPVLINGHGPFRLVLDTGASHSGVTAQVASELGIPLNRFPPMMLQGVTGRQQVQAIRVNDLTVGDLTLNSARLPIVTDALGGAEGVLGVEGLYDKRIFIDFAHDQISITRSHNERAGPSYMTIPLQRTTLGLIVVDAIIAGIPVKAIIDTGGQSSIGNLAMRDALARRQRDNGIVEHVEGVTTDVQVGESFAVPPIKIGPLEMRGVRVTYGDMRIFEHWKMTNYPVVLIGMDAIGTLEDVVIDYHRRELQVRLRHTGGFIEQQWMDQLTRN
jgi:predicted aspartyl protease